MDPLSSARRGTTTPASPEPPAPSTRSTVRVAPPSTPVIERSRLSAEQTRYLQVALGVSGEPCKQPGAPATSAQPPAAPRPGTPSKEPLALGRNLAAAGLAGPIVRDAYQKATAQAFAGAPGSRAQAERMVTARGMERLSVRAVSVGISAYSSYRSAQAHLERGDRARAAAEMIPAALTVGMNAGMVVRDTVKYGNPLGAMAGPAREKTVQKMLQEASKGATATSAARTSAAATRVLGAISKGMVHAGTLVDLSQLESDNPELRSELKRQEEEAKASGEWGCRKALGGVVNVCGPVKKEGK